MAWLTWFRGYTVVCWVLGHWWRPIPGAVGAVVCDRCGTVKA